VKKLRFWKKKENFFLLELSEEGVSAMLLGIGEDKKLVPKKEWADANCAKLIKRFRVKQLPKNIIVSASPVIAFTSVLPVVLMREAAGEEITATELENLLAQAVGRVFNQCRTEASKSLGIDDLDAILVGSRVLDFKIDGHKVMNPVGFSAGKLEAVLELVLTTRKVFNDIKVFVRGQSSIFFTEVGRAELSILQRTSDPPLGVVLLDHPRSHYSVMLKAPVQSLKRGELDWSIKSLNDSIVREWGITPLVAQGIYEAYLKKDFSPPVMKAMGKILKPASESLLATVRDQFKGPLYVNSPSSLPFPLPVKKGGVVLMEPPLADALQKFGFSVNLAEWPYPPNQVFKKLAPFLEFYGDKSDSTINHWLRRHLNWLGASV